ncbi:hypothetical protein HH310_19855 [Actinoplanes sp. TBRC 11911]|uniref:hypothetical protein n=1 Tax=Actinoplanes sp. TBRC 11911 TaxID=2729386 RepID=UPI00145D0270|nr:hypothetical protein [Actinoplanes sp. TBRC 11911]NMO53432.1 hypothetical protein [Actinoplanes sp. TBRC 11911]
MVRVSLEPYFLHHEQVVGLLGTQRAAQAADRSTRPAGLAVTAPYALAAALAEALPMLGIAELQKLVHEQQLRIGQIVGIEQTLTFRRAKERDQAGDKPVDFHATLNTDDSVTVHGSFNSSRLVADSAAGQLIGSRPVYVVGTVIAFDRSHIELRPAFVGVRSFIEDDELAAYGFTPSRRVYPADVDQFAAANFRSPVTQQDLDALLATPEETVKRTLAAIIGELFVHKDWGGEKSDLYSARLQVQGRYMSTAWLLKGPGFPKPMTVKALGKNGDQIVRLFSEPAELLVIQHCHEITPNVVSTMETFAHDLRNPRKYMVLDGPDTARVLKMHGIL